jgi:hypothetical protein
VVTFPVKVTPALNVTPTFERGLAAEIVTLEDESEYAELEYSSQPPLNVVDDRGGETHIRTSELGNPLRRKFSSGEHVPATHVQDASSTPKHAPRTGSPFGSVTVPEILVPEGNWMETDDAFVATRVA